MMGSTVSRIMHVNFRTLDGSLGFNAIWSICLIHHDVWWAAFQVQASQSVIEIVASQLSKKLVLMVLLEGTKMITWKKTTIWRCISLVNMVISLPAMLVYWRVRIFSIICLLEIWCLIKNWPPPPRGLPCAEWRMRRRFSTFFAWG